MSAACSILLIVLGGAVGIGWFVYANSATRVERMRREWERGRR